jgi:NAD(P)-dependent dehydrogenase (short-subunit alcohol dehydrogenase family)
VRCALNYSNNAERAQSTLAGLPGSGHIVLQADAFSKEGIQGLVAEAIKQLGALDILIGNSSWTTFAPWKLDALADEDYTKVGRLALAAFLNRGFADSSASSGM